MSIQAADIIWRQPTTRDDSASNGGRMTSVVNVSDVKNNMWPDVPQAERTSGSVKYRKAFIHIANDDDIPLLNPRLFVETYTPGDDAIGIFLGDDTDTQSGVTGSEQLYGCGYLKTDATALDTSITVVTEGETMTTVGEGSVDLDFFKVGMVVRISDKDDVNDATGNEEFVTLTSVSAYTGNDVTLTFTGDPLVNSYLVSSNTRVASVIEPADVETAYASFTETGGGTFDEATHLSLDSVGTVTQDWTITYDDPVTTVTITSGAPLNFTLANQPVSSAIQPSNPDYGKPYFVMAAAGFGGTPSAGDTLTFSTTQAAIPVWYKRIIPQSANSLSGDLAIVGISGESE